MQLTAEVHNRRLFYRKKCTAEQVPRMQCTTINERREVHRNLFSAKKSSQGLFAANNQTEHSPAEKNVW
jgi:hypothetical protein